MDSSAEVVFAQRLASNEKTIRDRTLKKLRKYLGTRASQTGFSRDELLKLWKGLHYCFWMQDKPLLQEELSEKMCGLLKAFPDGASALDFAAAFFAIQSNEWNRLDQWRMDKYMMLIRDFLNATFQVLKNNCWEEILVSRMSQLIEEEVMDAVKEEKPDGLRFHLADIYLVELTKLGADELNGEQILVFLKPFINYIVRSKRDNVIQKVTTTIFDTVLDKDTPPSYDSEEEKPVKPRLQYDHAAIRQALFDAGRSAKVSEKTRRRVYGLVKKFDGYTAVTKQTEQRHQPEEVTPAEDVESSTEVQQTVEDTAQETKKTETDPDGKPAKQKKKRKAPTEEHETSPPKKKKVKTKTPKKEQTPKAVASASEEATPESAKKHVAFNLERNSSRGLQEFVLSATTNTSPFHPGRSPRQSILKDSPSPAPTRSSKKAKKRAVLDSPLKAAAAAKGKTLFLKGRAFSVTRSDSDSGQDKLAGKKGKSSKFVSKKRGRMLKKPKHH